MYVKQYDENGLLINPITKSNPFTTKGANRKTRRFKQRKSNNSRGFGLVVARIGVATFMKYKIVKQNLKGKLIVNSVAI